MRSRAYFKNPLSRATIFLFVVWLMAATPVHSAFAQDEEDPDFDLPCGGNDPYGEGCPLDTWVYVLMIGGLAYGTYTLHCAGKLKQDIT